MQINTSDEDLEMVEPAPDTDEEVKNDDSDNPKESRTRVRFDDDGNLKASRDFRSFMLSPGGSLRNIVPNDKRADHFRQILEQRRASQRYIDQALLANLTSRDEEDPPQMQSRSIGFTKLETEPVSVMKHSDSIMQYLDDTAMKKLDKNTIFLQKVQSTYIEMLRKHFPSEQKSDTVEVRLSNLSYTAELDPSANKIKTVYNQTVLYTIRKMFERYRNGEAKPEPIIKTILDNINLVLKPGKMYLVLGPPASGKTTLLKAIAGRLSTENNAMCSGTITYNNMNLSEDTLLRRLKTIGNKEIHIKNAIAYVEQLDRHAPRLTVQETFDFAFQCKSGGSHAEGRPFKDDEAREAIAKLDEEDTRVKLFLEGLGLLHVGNTFVGNSDVRGVSGGQRRRVTVGEMLQFEAPIFCGDEISTGLDAASTYDICFQLNYFTKVMNTTRLISLLQPSPETVGLFDEVILLSDGKLIYAGPLSEVEDYFASLGYRAPDTMDVADFLQMLSTPDGAALFHPPEESIRSEPFTTSELADAFRHSQFGQQIQHDLTREWDAEWVQKKKTSIVDSATSLFTSTKSDVSTDSITRESLIKDGALTIPLQQQYQNSFAISTYLNVKRNLTIWLRDKRFLIANLVKNIIMGISVGSVFYQTDDTTSIFGVLFQSMLFIMLGAMVAAPAQVEDRTIFYRHKDANFYAPFPYALGKAIALIPQALLDVFVFGTIIYWMVGLVPTAANYFIFIGILFSFTLVMNQSLSIFAAVAPDTSTVQALSACVLLFNILFCGFIVFPDIIPDYYIWIYWFTPLAWAYRTLIVSEFQSPEVYENGEGDNILKSHGFTLDGEPFQREWIAYGFIYLASFFGACLCLTGLGLYFFRHSNASGSSSPDDVQEEDKAKEQEETEDEVNISFTPVTLTFKDVCYDVQSSTGTDTIRLLNDVNGIFEAGRMCALMGESGAGKTTLMDCIALRKNTGEITGEILLNGYEQEAITFRRCSGYVEQFDVQSSVLTVRETVLFSARLRLDSSNPATSNDENKRKFVDQVLKTLELTPLANSIVGDDASGGLSFEQRKRLSIAVELAASPSIIFLDEPTSGLDARAALIVTKALRQIADSGRTVIATIHQPSSAVFDMFDDLLLLKKGGRVVFHGELGKESNHLVKYFEKCSGTRIDRGENPANWMLKVLGDEDGKDFSEIYNESDECDTVAQKLMDAKEQRDPSREVKYETDFAAPKAVRQLELSKRLNLIYWRSPAYNLVRILISAMIGAILGAVFVDNRRPDVMSETEITSVLATMFISFIITGVLSITSVLPVMLEIRDVFYRHQAAGMVSHNALVYALGLAEKWFIVLSSAAFCVMFISLSGINGETGSSIAFWGFFTLNIAIYSYFGQAFMCLVKGMGTAQILASVFIGLNNFFSGYIVRPQFMEGLFQFTFWITPGHYVYEGMVVSIFTGDKRTVHASFNSEFADYLNCTENDFRYIADDFDNLEPDDPYLDLPLCEGSIENFVTMFFGNKFPLGVNRSTRDAIVLFIILMVSRFLTWWALKKFQYTS